MSFVYNKSINEKIFRLNNIGVYSNKKFSIEIKILIDLICSIFENSYLIITSNYDQYK